MKVMSRLARCVLRCPVAEAQQECVVQCMQHAALGGSRLSVGASRLLHCLLGIVNYFLLTRSGQENISLERKFNARNLGRIAGIQIAWTKNMADHLRLIDDENKVLIFHYASFLELQRDR